MTAAQPGIRDVFSQALEIELADDRKAFLEEACQGNEELRRKVEKLLVAHGAAGKFMNDPGTSPASTDCLTVGEGPGTVIGPYRLMEQIGEGGFGVVYVAQQEEPIARKVALKIV